MIDSLARYSFWTGFCFEVVDRPVYLQGTVDRFSCKVPFIDRFSFNVADREVLLQGTVYRQVFF